MSDFTPLARSAISAAEPLLIANGWEVSGARSNADLRVADCTPLAKVGVRADSRSERKLAEYGSEFAAALGVPLGRAVRNADGALVIGSSPGEWLILAAPNTATALVDQIRSLARDDFVTTIDLTCARVLLRLVGENAASLLAKLCAIDLDDLTTPNGSALRTSVAKVAADVVREDDHGTLSYWLHCEWSSGQYFFDALLDAGAEFGIEVDGFRSG